jgi:spore germination protein KA
MSDFKFTENGNAGPHPYEAPYENAPLTAEGLKNIFAECGDLQTRRVKIGLSGAVAAEALWLDGVVDGGGVAEEILRPLTENARFARARTAEEAAELMLCGGVYSCSVKKSGEARDTADDVAHGYCAVIFGELGVSVDFEVRTTNVRGISEPTLEKSVKGAKDSFVETLRINTSLVRRRVASPKLKLINVLIGRKTLTRCAVMYVDGVADPAIVEELLRRLDALDIDGPEESGYIESGVSDRPRSPLPQVLHTERPDRFASQLLGGRVGLLVDGMSFGFLVPATLPELMRVTQDRTNNFIVAGALSLLRWLALFLALTLPALFTAIAMYHQEMIPTKLLLSVVQAKQDVPFSIGVEVFSMLIAFGLLQEADLRLPDPVGDTVSIIGALIVGQSAVSAKVVSPIAVIIVALAGICNYAMPSQDIAAAVRLSRLALVVCAILAGLFGVSVGMCLMAWYLCGIESYGVNYLSPLTAGRPGGLFTTLLRMPVLSDKYRDPDLHTPDRRRQK